MNMCRVAPHPAFLLLAALAAYLLFVGGAAAVDFHVSDVPGLNTALVAAAVNGADDTVYLAANYYDTPGSISYESAEPHDLTIMAEPGTPADQVILDPNNTGEGLTINCSSTGKITVVGLSFKRYTTDDTTSGLRIGSVGDVEIRDCRFIAGAGDLGRGVTVFSAEDLVFENNTVAGNATTGGEGVVIEGVERDMTLRGNEVYRNKKLGIKITGTAQGNKVFLEDSSVWSNLAGGVYCDTGAGDDDVFVTGNLFSGNSAYGNGGGLYAYGGNSGDNTITMTENTIAENTVSVNGGGASLAYQTVIVSGNVIRDNATTSGSSDRGGAGLHIHSFFNPLQSVSVTDNEITGNSSAAGGGGVWIDYAPSATISGNVMLNNSAGGPGGALYLRTSGQQNQGVILANNFDGNTSSDGGGVYILGSTSTVDLQRNRFTDNFATSGNGGAARIEAASITNINNVAARNSASQQGGGFWLKGVDDVTVANATIYSNAAANGGGMYIEAEAGDVAQLRVHNSIVWGNVASGEGHDIYMTGNPTAPEAYHCDIHDVRGLWDYAGGLIDVDPVFFSPVNDDYHPRTGSPCLDAGTNGVTTLPATDLDGDPRVENGVVDIGAYEFSTTDLHPADINTNLVIEEGEYTDYGNRWKTDQSAANPPNPIPADFVTRAGYLLANGGTYYNDGGGKPLCWKPGIAP